MKIIKPKTTLKTTTFEEIKNEFFGKKGTPERDQYEKELKEEITKEKTKTRKIRL